MLQTLAAAILLILSFPKFSFSLCAWAAFVPMFLLADRLKDPKKMFVWFYFLGFLFFFFSVEWLRHVTYFGWLFVSVVWAFYFAVYGWIAACVLGRGRYLASIFVLPSAWTALEWIRSEIPVWGFGWNLLAYSQAGVRSVLRSSSVLGAFGVSWILVLSNVILFLWIRFFKNRSVNKIFVPALATALFIALLVPSVIGTQSISEDREHKIRIAVIQGNIPQNEKWEPLAKNKILETYLSLTEMTAGEKPDLVIWPEAAFPGDFARDPEAARVAALAKRMNTNLLLGSPHQEDRNTIWNSAFLVRGNDGALERSDKVRLVPFGEFIPWRPLFGLLGLEQLAYSMGVGDFSAGKEAGVFHLNGASLSPLICFEDTFPSLARRAVAKGAKLLIVLTNDAWFGRSAAAYQHLQASMFRAVENGVPVVRAANTGVSAFIRSDGKVIDRVQDARRFDTFVMGGVVRSIELGRGKTLHRFLAPWFPAVCAVVSLLGLVVPVNRKTPF